VIDPRRFRDVVGQFPTGVTVVTAPGPAGLTTNAFCSVSLDPPLVLVCFDNGSRTLTAVRESGRYAVNVLRAGQDDLAAVFASKRVSAEKFAAVAHASPNGVPVLDNALAWLVCKDVRLVDGGDHTIGIGEVCALDASDGEPLVFFRGSYRAL
jgi:3-hydroxy-9,10-secoandrosta-1,3,5(10)-triene-9,17-dione monooxygenase reductase component